mmetsp:Transcript_58166/g.173585  ORF Transcript_58166/g.173585 Transcript_58166/m.173585 type:complete len:254 (-) Transcript_58166:194-955(-)
MTPRRTSFFRFLCTTWPILMSPYLVVAEGNSTCSLCEDRSQPTEPNTRVVLPDGTVPCSYLSDEAASVTDNEECDKLHNIGKNFCGCGAKPPPPCSLCHDGSALPEPDRIIADDKSCAALEDSAKADFESDCIWWQGLMGPLCGCPGEPPALPDDTCLICPGNALPEPEKILQLSNGEQTSCIQLQMEANKNSYVNCGSFQVLYAEVCNCFKENADTETKQIPASPAHGSNFVLKTQVVLFAFSLSFGASLFT